MRSLAEDLEAARAAAAYARWRALPYAERDRQEAACVGCGVDTREVAGIPYGGRHGRLYCSNACRQRAYRRRRYASQLARTSVTKAST